MATLKVTLSDKISETTSNFYKYSANRSYHICPYSTITAVTGRIKITTTVPFAASCRIALSSSSSGDPNGTTLIDWGDSVKYSFSKDFSELINSMYTSGANVGQYKNNYLVLVCKGSLRTYTLEEYYYTITYTPSKTTINVASNNTNYGTVSGGGTWENTQQNITTSTVIRSATITATPEAGYRFVKWNDGNTSASRTISIKATDLNAANSVFTYTATFEPITYSISTEASPSSYGTVSGGGSYNYGATATLIATPNTGYKFVKWNDGNTNATRSFTVTSSASYIAYFQPVYVLYDTLFSFRRWKDTNLASWQYMDIYNINEIGFTGTALVDDAYTNESRPLIKVEANREYILEVDVESSAQFQFFIFFCNADGSWGSFAYTPESQQKSVRFTPTTNYISIRCDIVGTGNIATFSNFRMYPADYAYMASTLSASERTDTQTWSMPTPSRPGYTFLGWYTQPNGQGIKYTSSSVYPTEDIVLYSHWEETIQLIPLFVGEVQVKEIYVGNQKVKEIYLGNTRIY